MDAQEFVNLSEVLPNLTDDNLKDPFIILINFLIAHVVAIKDSLFNDTRGAMKRIYEALKTYHQATIFTLLFNEKKRAHYTELAKKNGKDVLDVYVARVLNDDLAHRGWTGNSVAYGIRPMRLILAMDDRQALKSFMDSQLRDSGIVADSDFEVVRAIYGSLIDDLFNDNKEIEASFEDLRAIAFTFTIHMSENTPLTKADFKPTTVKRPLEEEEEDLVQSDKRQRTANDLALIIPKLTIMHTRQPWLVFLCYLIGRAFFLANPDGTDEAGRMAEILAALSYNLKEYTDYYNESNEEDDCDEDGNDYEAEVVMQNALEDDDELVKAGKFKDAGRWFSTIEKEDLLEQIDHFLRGELGMEDDNATDISDTYGELFDQVYNEDVFMPNEALKIYANVIAEHFVSKEPFTIADLPGWSNKEIKAIRPRK